MESTNRLTISKKSEQSAEPYQAPLVKKPLMSSGAALWRQESPYEFMRPPIWRFLTSTKHTKQSLTTCPVSPNFAKFRSAMGWANSTCRLANCRQTTNISQRWQLQG